MPKYEKYMKKGYKLTEEHKRKIALGHLGQKRPPFSEEWRAKIGAASLGNKHALGTVRSEEANRKSSEYMKGRKHQNHALTVERIYKECEELERQGFRAVPTGAKVVPDIVAVRDNKIYAVEVEYGTPNYGKYTGDIQKYYDDVIWIIRKPRKESA